MKKCLVSIALLAIVFTGYSQKVYQTKGAKVNFFSATPFMDIKADNAEVSSKLSTNGQVIIMIAIRSFDFENKLMQEHFNENYMESGKFPKSTFQGRIKDIANINFEKDASYRVLVDGVLEMHGVKKQVAIPALLAIKSGNVHASAEFMVSMKDYNIKGGYIGTKIASEVKVSFNAIYE